MDEERKRQMRKEILERIELEESVKKEYFPEKMGRAIPCRFRLISVRLPFLSVLNRSRFVPRAARPFWRTARTA